MCGEDGIAIGYPGNCACFVDKGCLMTGDIEAGDRQKGEFKVGT